MKLHLRILRSSETTIECKEFTCSPCGHFHFQMADAWGPGKAHCDLFGDLKWPKTMGEIERLPQCRELDTQATPPPLKDGNGIVIVGIEQ